MLVIVIVDCVLSVVYCICIYACLCYVLCSLFYDVIPGIPLTPLHICHV